MGAGSSQPRQGRQVLLLCQGGHRKQNDFPQVRWLGLEPRCTCVQNTALGAIVWVAETEIGPRQILLASGLQAQGVYKTNIRERGSNMSALEISHVWAGVSWTYLIPSLRQGSWGLERSNQ